MHKMCMWHVWVDQNWSWFFDLFNKTVLMLKSKFYQLRYFFCLWLILSVKRVISRKPLNLRAVHCIWHQMFYYWSWFVKLNSMASFPHRLPVWYNCCAIQVAFFSCNVMVSSSWQTVATANRCWFTDPF